MDPFHLSDEEIDGSDKEQDEFNGELEAIQLTFLQNRGLLTTYTAWLQLMVTQFDAVEIVVQHIQKLQCNTVSVNILVTPMTDEILLPWQELFSGCYLPNMDSGNNAWDIPSQDVIHDFLEEGISRAGAVKEELRLGKISCT